MTHAVAAYALDATQERPRELTWALRSERWGLPSGGGWLDEHAGLVDRMTAALNVYQAFRAYADRKDEASFSMQNPGAWRLVIDIQQQMQNG